MLQYRLISYQSLPTGDFIKKVKANGNRVNTKQLKNGKITLLEQRYQSHESKPTA